MAAGWTEAKSGLCGIMGMWRCVHPEINLHVVPLDEKYIRQQQLEGRKIPALLENRTPVPLYHHKRCTSTSWVLGRCVFPPHTLLRNSLPTVSSLSILLSVQQNPTRVVGLTRYAAVHLPILHTFAVRLRIFSFLSFERSSQSLSDC